MDAAHATTVRDKLRKWILVDRENIANRHAGIHWTVGPEKWETNELITQDTQMMVSMFWNAKNLQKCEQNFGRTATELRLTLRQALGEAAEQLPENAPTVDALETVIRSYVHCIDPPSRAALERYAGMRFGPGGPSIGGN